MSEVDVEILLKDLRRLEAEAWGVADFLGDGNQELMCDAIDEARILGDAIKLIEGGTMSGAQDSVVDSDANQEDIERCLEAAVMWMRERRDIPQTHSNAEWKLFEAAMDIMDTTYDEGEV